MKDFFVEKYTDKVVNMGFLDENNVNVNMSAEGKGRRQAIYDQESK